MLVGYARVSTQDQDPALQLDALRKAVCEKIFTEKASGAQRDRPKLEAATGYMRKGDTLVVWKLDRLARSVKQLIETVEALGEQASAFARSPKPSTPRPMVAGWFSTSSQRSLNSSGRSSASAP